MDSPWYPSENAQMDASGPIPACVAIAVPTGYSEPLEAHFPSAVAEEEEEFPSNLV